jgi:hypothetical protein
MMMNSGAAMPAAVNRIPAASSPAMMYLRSEGQYLTRLMRLLAPNWNSNSSWMVALHG